MGPQRILQEARSVGSRAAFAAFAAGAVVTGVADPAHAAPTKLHERVAVIDLGPSDNGAGATRGRIATAIVAAGLDPVIGDRVEDALAGDAADLDGAQLAAAMAEAGRAFGVFDCATATSSATIATTLGAAREAAGLPVPELPRAWTYLLLCANRGGATDTAMFAASQLRAVGGSTDVPADLWAQYPDVDTIAGHDLVAVDVTSDAVGASIWIDHRRAGIAPLHVVLAAGTHVIAAASGSRRFAVQTAVTPAMPAIHVSTPDMKGPWSDVAARIAAWHGKVPAPAELAWVMGRVRARVAIVRYGETIEVWGQPGHAEPPRRIGGEDGVGTLADLTRLMGLVADRAHVWNDRAPDPDQPLLLDTTALRNHKRVPEEPTRWWVYASIAGAIAAAAVVVYVHDNASDTQHVELHFP